MYSLDHWVGGVQHFMTKMGASGSADERFVDVFRGGVLLTRCAQPGGCSHACHADAPACHNSSHLRMWACCERCRVKRGVLCMRHWWRLIVCD